MKNLFDKQDLKKVDAFNRLMGMQHRSKPYDINNRDDLYEMLKLKVCAFLDYFEYHMTICEVLEKLDESVEHFDTATWLSFTEEINNPDKLLIKCYDSVSKADDYLYKLANRAEKELIDVLKIVKSKSDDIQISILGFSLKNVSMKKIQEVFDNAYIFENKHNMEEAFDKFKVCLKGCFFKEADI